MKNHFGMKNILLIGAGKIGSAIAKMLCWIGEANHPAHLLSGEDPVYFLSVADVSHNALSKLNKVRKVHITDYQTFLQTFGEYDAVISACPFDKNTEIAKHCAIAGTSYFDLTEDVETTNFIKQLADDAKEGQIYMPQCGLAPGYIGILANHLIRKFKEPVSVKMRVGALPLYPNNAIKYNLTWSTAGLINEYCNPCEAIINGKKVQVQALEGLEHFSVEGIEYEAFNTSGGLGTLCETFEGQIANLDYKTARYPGHRDLMDFLINGLGFRNKREELKKLFDEQIPLTKQDLILILCSVSGYQDSNLVEESIIQKIYSHQINGEHWSGIQIATAAGICTAVDLHFSGKLPARGFVRQEDVNYNDFIDNRFGHQYRVPVGK